MINYFVILICVLVVALGQSLFKAVGIRLAGENLLHIYEDKVATSLLVLALASYGLSTMGWVWVLREVPLSTAYLFMSISFIIVPLCAYWFFNEQLSLQYAIGCLMIVAGIFIASTA